jgi:hypothetical protein
MLLKIYVRKFNNNSLILVNHLAHGDALFDDLSQIENKKVFLLKVKLK